MEPVEVAYIFFSKHMLIFMLKLHAQVSGLLLYPVLKHQWPTCSFFSFCIFIIFIQCYVCSEVYSNLL